MQYRCAATSLEGFIQQLAVGYVARVYWFYVSGRVSERTSANEVDRALVEKFNIAISPQARARRKRAGGANVHYLRHERFFVLGSTYGRHRFFDEHRTTFRDLRRVPIKYGISSVSFRGGHASVRLTQGAYRDLKAYFLERAVRAPASQPAREFWRLNVEPYAPVRRQVFNILRETDRLRKRAGRDPVSQKCLRLKRRQILVFSDPLPGSLDFCGPSNRDDWRGAIKRAA